VGYIDLEKKLFSYKTTAGNILRSYKLIFHEQKTVFILKILSLTVAPILSYIILLLSKNAINRIEQSNSSFLYVVLCVSVIIVLEIVSVVYDRILFFFSDLTSSAFSERLRSDLLRKIAEELSQRDDIKAEYMPQNYEEILDLDMTPVDFWQKTE